MSTNLRTLMALASILLATVGTTSASQARDGSPIDGRPGTSHVLDPDLVEALAAADPDEPMIVFVHSETIEDAVRATSAAGLQLVERWQRIGVAVALGVPASIRRVAADASVRYVEPNRPVEFALPTAHIATRAQEARDPDAGLLSPADTPYDGTGITIAINDSGIDATHPMFTDNGVSKVARNLRQMCPAPYYGADAPCDLWVDVDNSDFVYRMSTVHPEAIALSHGQPSVV